MAFMVAEGYLRGTFEVNILLERKAESDHNQIDTDISNDNKVTI